MPKSSKSRFSTNLLAWYDDHARVLPWRVSPAARKAGRKPDPYRVWLSEIMLQQTTVATVTPRFEAFLTKWPDVKALAAADQEDVLGEWAGLGYYARARNLHACAKLVAEEFDGVFPDTEEDLLALPGVGPYTAAAISAIAFDRPATVVDGNVDRIMVRRFAIERPIREAKSEIYECADSLTPSKRTGDYAQALMDLGATICRPKWPQCLLCPVRTGCLANEKGIAESLPVKPPKKKRPTRYGTVYVAMNASGDVLTERRPEKGLFGGMSGLPGSEWALETLPAEAPFKADWVEAGEIEHTLTHFHLVLKVYSTLIARTSKNMFWTQVDQYDTLPTVFRKAVDKVIET